MPQPADETRLGELLVTTGKLSSEELLAALESQHQQGGPMRKRLGEILVDRGHVTVEELQTCLGHQDKQILWCPRCQVQVNVQGVVPGARYGCRQCRGELQPVAPSRSTVVKETWPAMPVPAVSSESVSDEVRQAMADPSRRIGHYARVEELGRGGMGVVYRCYDLQLNRSVAIKMLLDDPLPSSDDDLASNLARFKSEARAAAKLQHPGIVALHEVGEHQGSPYLVMDFVEGRSFDALLRHEKPTARRIAEIVREVALALDHAHSAGIIHRDVKPQNVMVDPQGKPHVMDFGLARDSSAQQQLTKTGQIMGTPVYMAPEQIEVGEMGPWTDVYALGVMLYRALTGKLPFTAGNPTVLFKQIIMDEPKALRSLDPTISRDLETITLKCMEKLSDRRYPSAAVVAEEIQRFLDGRAILARPIGKGERAIRWVRRNRALSAALAVVGLVVVGSSIGGIVQNRRNQTSEREAVLRERQAIVKKARDVASRTAAALRAARMAADQEGISDGQRRRRYDAVMAKGLEAFGAAASLGSLVPDDASARSQRFDVAMALGEVASEAQQWSVARSAFEQAAGLDVDDTRAAEALDGVEQARTRVHEEHRQAVERVLSLDRADELMNAERYRDAVIELVRYSESQTVALLASRLDGLTHALRAAAADTYLSAAMPTEDEARAVAARPRRSRETLPLLPRRVVDEDEGTGELEGLAAAVERWRALAPGQEADSGIKALLELAAERLELLARRGPTTKNETPGARDILASAQAKRLGKGRLALARLCCEALGRIGIRDGGIEPLRRHLLAEEAEVRAKDSAVALCRLGEGDAEIALLVAGRFARTGSFWREVARYLPGANRVVGSETLATALDYLGRGRQRSEEGDLGGAIADYTRVLELDPSLADAWSRRGAIREIKGDLDGAIADFSRAIELEPNHLYAWNERGISRRATGDLDGAIADFTRAMELDPQNVAATQNRGRARAVRGDLDGALADFLRAIELDPRNVRAWAARGELRSSQDDFDGAIADFSRALEFNPGSAEAVDVLVLRGVARRRKGDLEGAAADFSRAIEIDPSPPEAWGFRSEIRLVMGDIDGAVADSSRLVELAPELAHAWGSRGNVLVATGQFDGATSAYSRAIELDPRFAKAFLNRGSARSKTGDFNGAIADWRRFLELAPDHPAAPAVRAAIEERIAELSRVPDPDDAESWLMRGSLRLETGDFDGALADSSRALEVDPSLAMAWFIRGTARRGKGAFDGAVAAYSRAIELDPSLVESWLNRGALRLKKGDLDGALADSSRALDLDPSYAGAWANRGVARALKGDFDGAIADCSQAIELNPADVAVWVNRGTFRRNAGDLDGALADFSQALELEPRNARFWANSGELRCEQNDFDGAIADLSRATVLAPRFAAAWETLGFARANKGDVEGAIADFSMAIELGPEEFAAWNHRGSLRLEKGDLGGAISDFSRVIELAPRFAEVWVNRGKALAAAGRREEAIADFEKFLELAPRHRTAAIARKRIVELRQGKD